MSEDEEGLKELLKNHLSEDNTTIELIGKVFENIHDLDKLLFKVKEKRRELLWNDILKHECDVYIKKIKLEKEVIKNGRKAIRK